MATEPSGGVISRPTRSIPARTESWRRWRASRLSRREREVRRRDRAANGPTGDRSGPCPGRRVGAGDPDRVRRLRMSFLRESLPGPEAGQGAHGRPAALRVPQFPPREPPPRGARGGGGRVGGDAGGQRVVLDHARSAVRAPEGAGRPGFGGLCGASRRRRPDGAHGPGRSALPGLRPRLVHEGRAERGERHAHLVRRRDPVRRPPRRGDPRRGPRARQYSVYRWLSEKCPPCGSMQLTIQDPSGTSIGPLSTWPPLALTSSAPLFTSATRKYSPQWGGTWAISAGLFMIPPRSHCRAKMWYFPIGPMSMALVSRQP